MIKLHQFSFFILASLLLTSCSDESETTAKSPEEIAKEEAASLEGPKNWKEIKLAIVSRDAEALRALTPEKINEERFNKLIARLFQDDINKAMAGTKFKDLVSIGQNGDEIYAFYFGGTTIAGDYTYKHDTEMFVKLLPDGLCVWNFMLAE